jgi:hypothetical protein
LLSGLNKQTQHKLRWPSVHRTRLQIIKIHLVWTTRFLEVFGFLFPCQAFIFTATILQLQQNALTLAFKGSWFNGTMAIKNRAASNYMFYEIAITLSIMSFAKTWKYFGAHYTI